MASASSEADDLRRRMAQLRMNLHNDMRGVVAGAEAATDWRSYVRQYPWAALASSFCAGFLLVPRRRRSIHQTAEAAATATAEKVKDAAAGQVRSPRSLGWMLPLLAPVVIRAAQGYAAQYIDRLLVRQGAGGPENPSERSDSTGELRHSEPSSERYRQR